LQGFIDGKKEEPYILLSVNKAVNAETLPSKTIGVVDFLSKKDMEDFTRKLLESPVKLKRVKKVEDLLPLLSFNMVDAILIPEIQISYFKGTSNLNFKILRLPSAQADIASLALKKGTSASVILKQIKRIPKSVNIMLGVEEWR
jgi:hypothetical protein